MSMPAPPPAPPRKGLHPVIIILFVLIGLFAIAVTAIIGGGLYFAHKLKNDPAAIVRLVTAAHPNIDVISTDLGNGTVTVRDKNTGKQVTLNFDDIKRGQIRFTEDGKEVNIKANADENGGTVEVTSSDGTKTQYSGGSGKIPLWVPVYPGTPSHGAIVTRGPDQESGTTSFTLKEPVSKISSYYSDELKKQGFKVTTTSHDQGSVLQGEDAEGKRTVIYTLVSGGDGVAVNVAFTSRNKE